MIKITEQNERELAAIRRPFYNVLLCATIVTAAQVIYIAGFQLAALEGQDQPMVLALYVLLAVSLLALLGLEISLVVGLLRVRRLLLKPPKE